MPLTTYITKDTEPSTVQAIFYKQDASNRSEVLLCVPELKLYFADALYYTHPSNGTNFFVPGHWFVRTEDGRIQILNDLFFCTHYINPDAEPPAPEPIHVDLRFTFDRVTEFGATFLHFRNVRAVANPLTEDEASDIQDLFSQSDFFYEKTVPDIIGEFDRIDKFKDN